MFLMKLREWNEDEEKLWSALTKQADQILEHEKFKRTYVEWWFAQAKLDQEKREKIYELVLQATKESEAIIERAQFMTGAESLQELASVALHFYIYVINSRSEGGRLFIGKTLSKAVLLKFAPLDRVKLKVDN